MSDHTQRRRKTIVRFIFPLAPIKVLRSTKLICVLALLFALRIIFGIIAIPIPGFVLNFSFAYVPVMLIGWYFGVVYGLICGAIADTTMFLLFPDGLWFWMYAIQEPIVGMLAGLFASWCRYRQSKPKINIGVDVVIQQIIYIIFAVVCYTVLTIWLSHSKYDQELYLVYRWVAISFVTAFFILLEIFTFYNLTINRQNTNRNITFIYSFILIGLVTLMFSFMLGPIATIAYLEYLNHTQPDALVKYGVIYYLMPRVILQSIKTPLEATIMTSLIFAIDPIINRMINNINQSWLLT